MTTEELTMVYNNAKYYLMKGDIEKARLYYSKYKEFGGTENIEGLN